MKLFFVPGSRHHSRWAHPGSALRDSLLSAAVGALPQLGLAKLTLHQLPSEVMQLCRELSTNAWGFPSQ